MGEAKEVPTQQQQQSEQHVPNGYYPRDLLQRLSSRDLDNHHQTQPQPQLVNGEEPAPEEIELNLCLSLGGRFGVDPKETNNNNKLIRSTSIAGLTTVTRENDMGAPPPVFVPSLFRTTSLPTETEEEWRKRKEMQCLRRMEAKRKRSEKQQKSLRIRSDRASLEPNSDDKRIDGGVVVPLPVPPGLMGTTSGTTCAAVVAASVVPKQQHNYMVANGVSGASNLLLPTWATRGSGGVAAPGSVGSQGSSSTSEISGPLQGSSNCTEARSPASVQSLPELNDQKPSISPTSTIKKETIVPAKVEVETASKKPKLENGVMESGMKAVEEMPCVSTKGDGPDGRKIDGFLYKYKKGEEVRIVCVCHGSFLSPAEFVKHAGGGDVAHPLRHIVVNPSPSFC